MWLSFLTVELEEAQFRGSRFRRISARTDPLRSRRGGIRLDKAQCAFYASRVLSVLIVGLERHRLPVCHAAIALHIYGASPARCLPAFQDCRLSQCRARSERNPFPWEDEEAESESEIEIAIIVAWYNRHLQICDASIEAAC